MLEVAAGEQLCSRVPRGIMGAASLAVAHYRGCHVDKQGLSFVDGFRFGCGFVAALVSFWVALSIALAIVGVILALLGFSDLGTILRRMGAW